MDERLKSFERLLNIIDELREKCPWDKKQNFESLRYLTIEETYELSDAITENNTEDIKGELGDLIMHIVFYSKIASEHNDFDISDVINGVCEKLIYRHPHIYGNVKVEDEEDVKNNWEKLKLKSGRKSVLEGVPASLPALVKTVRIQEKVKGVGFRWDNKEQSYKKVIEELAELKEEVHINSENKESEFGDVIFSLVNYAGFIDVNPVTALEKTNKKFIKRFQKMEELLKEQKLTLSEIDLDKMEEFWVKAKNIVG